MMEAFYIVSEKSNLTKMEAYNILEYDGKHVFATCTDAIDEAVLRLKNNSSFKGFLVYTVFVEKTELPFGGYDGDYCVFALNQSFGISKVDNKEGVVLVMDFWNGDVWDLEIDSLEEEDDEKA